MYLKRHFPKTFIMTVSAIMASVMVVTGCGAESTTTADQDAAYAEASRAAVESDQSNAGGVGDSQEKKWSNNAGETQEETQDIPDYASMSDEDFYCEILDLYYYELEKQTVYDSFQYYEGVNPMVTYAYSNDGFDKAGALDYSGYGFEDLDGDGINELIIGNLSEDDFLEKKIYLICTKRNNAPFELIRGSDDSAYYLCTGKLIGYQSNGDGWYSNSCLYEYESLEKGISYVVGVSSSKGDNDTKVWKKTDINGRETQITDDEAQGILDEYRDRRVQAELTAFSQYKPRNEYAYYDGVYDMPYGRGYSSWNDAYLSYIEQGRYEDESGFSYALIYVDNDDIPELVCDTGFEAGGCQILAYHDGELRELQTNRLYFTYIKNTGLLDNAGGHMGYYFDYVYQLDRGRWKNIFAGDYNEFDESGEIEYDEETGRYRTLYYFVNGEETDEKNYLEQLNAVYDSSRAKAPESYLRKDDLLSFLNTGKLASEGHRYELFVEDCTWDEAQKKCEDMGGYLACMTCDEEFDLVEKLIRSEGKEDICFYIGANRIGDQWWHWVDPGLTQNECVGNGYWKHWLDGSPSYTGTLPDGTEINEEYAEYIYIKAEDKFYINDIPNDVVGNYPSFSGRMGYICEFPG